MELIVVSFLSFVIWTCVVLKRDGIAASSFILLLYTGSYLAALLLIHYYNVSFDRQINYGLSQLYLFIALFISILPITSIRESKVKSIIVPSFKYLDLFAAGTTTLSLFSLFYFAPSAYKVITLDSSQIAYMRNLVAEGNNPFINQTIFNTIAGVSANFYFIQIVLFYIYLIKNQSLSWKLYVIFFSSLSYVIHVFAYVGRDGVVFWLLSFILVSLFFLPSLNSTIKSRIKKLLINTSMPIIVVFAIITFGRFIYGNADEQPFRTLFDYFGQGPINFAKSYTLNLPPLGGYMNFPLFVSQYDVDIANQNAAIMQQYGVSNTVFSTYVGSLLADFGRIGTLLFLASVSFILYIYSLSNKRCWSFSFMLIYYLYVNVISQGIFYFRQSNNAGNLVIITVVILAVCFSIIPKQRILINQSIKK